MAEQPNQTVSDPTIVILNNVQIAFPDLFVPKDYQGDGKFKRKATLLVTPGSANDKKVWAAIQAAAERKWDKKAQVKLDGIKGQKKEFCYLSGDTKEYEGYAGKMALAASRRISDGKVLVLDQQLQELTGNEGIPYAGSFVNAKVQFWAQDNATGLGMRCTLVTVQFAGHGEAFGGAIQPSADGFESVEVESDVL